MHLDSCLNLGLLILIRLFGIPVTINGLLVGVLVQLHAINLGLHALIVTLLQAHNFSSALLCFFDLFPGAHLFLFQESDTVGEELRITLDTLHIETNTSYEK